MMSSMATTMMKGTMAPTTERPDAAAADPDLTPAPWWRRLLAGVRVRILGWYIFLLALAVMATLLLERSILLDRHDEEVESQLRQEVEELKNLAGGLDPNTGEPFATDIAAVFDTFWRRNVPGEGETFLFIVPGRRPIATPSPVPLDARPVRLERWSTLVESEPGEFETPAGPVRYLAVPLRSGETTLGTFVVANFLRGEREEIESTVRVGAAVAASVLLVASALAWVVAGRLLRPVRLLTDTARSIGESDLSGRIEVEGTDEVAELGRTFNHMLDRLDVAFATRQAFLDDAGHELRTPITIVRGHLELLDEDTDEHRETLALVLDELDRMTRIVDDLLLLAKVEQPDFLQPGPLDLNAMTRGWQARATSLADRDWQLAHVAEVEVVADGQRLTQAVMNLAQNAAQHTTAGDTIELGSVVVDDQARLWVRDRGPGVALEDQQRIFERFARAGGGRRHSEGAGLGLAIVSAIARAHGGRVELSSRPGGGSTFTIVVPVGHRNAVDGA